MKYKSVINLLQILSVFLITALLSVGCNIMKITSNYDKTLDFKIYKTFTISQSIKNLRLNSDNKLILEDAISSEMKARGYSTITSDYHDCKNGTLFMNIIDAKKKVVIWTGRITTGIQEGQTEKEREKLIDKVVKKLYKKYPVPAMTNK
jgi:hypothetical protein